MAPLSRLALLCCLPALLLACSGRPAPKAPAPVEDKRRTERDPAPAQKHRSEPPGYGHEVVRSTCDDEIEAGLPECPDLRATE